MVISEELSMGHARALLPLDERDQLRLARLVVDRDLSVREVERRVKRILEPPARVSGETTDPNVVRAEEKLEEIWKTRVQIRQRGEHGIIAFHFHSAEELQRLFEELMRSR
jgi:ParB family chromosome partitioning protein